MMRQYELVERVQRYKPDVNEALLNKAYVYAMQKHGHQKRASGDPYFSHPLEVAAILTDMQLDEATIAVALLHDTIEDTTATRAEIDELFGAGHRQAGRGADQAEEARPRLQEGRAGGEPAQAAAGDLRGRPRAAGQARRPPAQHAHARPHAAGQARCASPRRRWRSMRRSPAAWACRTCARSWRNWPSATSIPKPTAPSPSGLPKSSSATRGVIGEIEKALSALFEKHGIKAEVKSRAEEALVGVPQDGSQGAVLRAALRHLRLPRRRRHGRGLLPRARRDPHDLVDGAGPLQGLHLDAEAERLPLDPHHHRRPVAPARRTADPHPRDEQDRRIRRRRALRSTRTPAASRTAPATPISKETNAYAWLRRTIEQLAEGDNPEDFLENTKLELFQDQVFCFTPKGRLIALPRGATPIDFAYAVHTDVGDTCVGAKVNGRIMPLMTELKNGDEVEIIRSKAQVPPAAWESIVVTGKARSAIRRATKNAIRKQYSGLGVRILERAFERAGKTFSKESLKPVLHRLAPQGRRGCAGRRRPRRAAVDATCMKAVYPDYKDERVTAARRSRARRAGSTCATPPACCSRCPGARRARSGRGRKASGDAVPIRGVRGDLPVRFAPEGAVPGDRIVGIMQPGAGITIYPIQSPSLHGIRRPAGALDRRALGHRREQQGALSGARSR